MKSMSVLGAIILMIACSLVRAEQLPYTDAAFDKLVENGKSVLIVIHASWCPTCRAQGPIINELLDEKEFTDITALRIDFDTQKPALKAFNARQQSTLISFKGKKEVGRSVGDTNKASIKQLLIKSLYVNLCYPLAQSD